MCYLTDSLRILPSLYKIEKIRQTDCGEGGITQAYSLRPSGHRHFIPALSRATGARLEHRFLPNPPSYRYKKASIKEAFLYLAGGRK